MKIIDKMLVIALCVALFGCSDFQYAEYQVTEKPYVDQTSVELFLDTDSKMASIQLKASPANRQYTWTSQNSAIATVTQNGLVAAKSEGYTNIIVTSNDDQFVVSVHVQKWVAMESISLDLTTVDKLWLGVIDRFKLNVIFEPSNTTEKDAIEWSSSRPDVATVSQEGWVTYTKDGRATITAKAINGVEASTVLTIFEPPVYKLTDPEFIDRNGMWFPGFRNTSDSQWGYSSQNACDGPSGLTFKSDIYGDVAYCSGTVLAMLDNRTDTYYHARWSGAASDYPHWFIIDLGEVTPIGGFMVQNRQGDSRSGTGCQFFTTEMEVASPSDLAESSIWTNAGRYNYATGDAAQSFSLLPPYPMARYVKVYFGPEYKNNFNYVMMAEFGLYRPKPFVDPDEKK